MSLKLSERDEITEWMVNYIAEQIIESENSDQDIQLASKQQCFDTILKLWEYRAYFPNGTRPFEQFEEIFRSLESLDPENPYPRHYQLPEQNQPVLSDDALSWIELGKNLDNTARILVSFSFDQAIRSTLDKASLEWLKLIKNTVKSEETRIVFKILGSDENEEDTDLKKEKIEIFENRIKQLKAFEDISSNLRQELSSQLQSLNSES